MPQLRPYQVDLIRSEKPEIVAVGAAQSGKTFVYCCWLLGKSFEKPMSVNWWAAPTYSQGEIAFDEMLRIARGSGLIVKSWRGRRHVLSNGARIDFRSWERDENLLGPSVYNMVIDQAEMLTPRAHTILSSRRAATLGPICYGGNAGVRGSEFHRLCQLARSGQVPTMSLVEWTWRDVLGAMEEHQRPGFEAFLRAERVRVGQEEFERMYEGRFLDLGAGLVDLRPVCTLGGSETQPIGLPWFAPWEPDEDCVAGLDFGQEIDYTVLIVVGQDSGQAKAIDRFKTIPWKAQVARVASTLALYSRKSSEAKEKGLRSRSLPVYLDATGLGSPVWEMLEEATARLAVDLVPIKFTQDKQHRMVTAVQVSVEQRTVSLPYCAELVSEADTLERKLSKQGISYGAAPGFHDDCFWSLGLACYGRSMAVTGMIR